MLAALLPLLIATEETSLPDLFPAPANASFAGGCLALSPSFHIRVPQSGDAAGSLLERAASRYEAIVRSDARTPSAYCTCAGARPLPQISSLVVSVPDAALRAAATPAIGDDEAYELRVGTGVSTLTASSVWGAVRGLETLSQLVVADAKGAAADGIVCAASVHVSDAPRFPHRGLMLDTGRRFLSVPQILATLDAMSYAKLNVLHWHLVDDPAFPLEVVSLPLLSGKGALNAPRKTHTYTPADVAAVVAAASDRGIRVIPELDSPGHATSWYRGYPHLATVCPNAAPAEYYNPPMDPTSPAVDSFLRTLWHEVGLAFPDRYVHIGGDEVWFECWAANVTIAKYMRDHSINSTAELQALFEAKVREAARA